MDNINTEWKIFVMFHKVLIDNNYRQDRSFNQNNFNFIKANEEFTAEYNINYFKEILYEKDFKFYNEDLQKKNYFAPSIIYHIYKNKVHEKYKYIGFIEYDIPLIPPPDVSWTSFTEEVQRIVNTNDKIIIPFRYIHKISELRKQTDIKLKGVNSIDKLFYLYNHFWNTNYKVENYLNSFIVTQQSFLCDNRTFINVLKFISYLIENKILESKNTWPLPATILERAFGIALLLEKDTKTMAIPMSHQNMELWEMPENIFIKFLRRCKKSLIKVYRKG